MCNSLCFNCYSLFRLLDIFLDTLIMDDLSRDHEKILNDDM